jgi:hypothetical protein
MGLPSRVVSLGADTGTLFAKHEGCRPYRTAPTMCRISEMTPLNRAMLDSRPNKQRKAKVFMNNRSQAVRVAQGVSVSDAGSIHTETRKRSGPFPSAI